MDDIARPPRFMDDRPSSDEFDLEPEGPGDRVDKVDGWVRDPALDPADVAPRHADPIPELLLCHVERQSRIEAESPEGSTDRDATMGRVRQHRPS